jgi:DNA (cytosine-5)-methyltransferase 1
MQPSAFYNENDPYPAQWLRNLSDAGHIAPGIVNERSVSDLGPGEVEGFKQCHFFAGIGGWSYALRLAGWPDDELVWTGSCPCQPFSVATYGKGKGTDDARHLWPSFFNLIRAVRPSVVFGEQVAGPNGREWLAGVRANLESIGYAVGAADLCSPGVGAPHVRSRLYWVANADGDGGESRNHQIPCESGTDQEVRSTVPFGRSGRARVWDSAASLVGRDGGRYRVENRPGTFPLAHGVPARMGRLRAYGNAIVPQVAAAFIRSYMEASALGRRCGVR